MQTFVVGLAGAAFLGVFYANVRSDWPENYSSMSDAVDTFVSANIIRFLLFRVAPIYLTGVLVGVTVERLNGSVQVALLLLVGIHLGVTNGRAIVELLIRGQRSARRSSLILYHALVAVLGAVAGLVAACTYAAWNSMIPGPKEVVSSLWTGLFAAVLVVFAQRFFAMSTAEPDLLWRGRNDVGQDLWDLSRESALAHSCDVNFVRSILLAESLQRPSWIRALERTKGRLFRTGSYGVAQMTSSAPISDEESIERLCESFAGYFPERSTPSASASRSRMAARFEDHNSDPEFVKLATELYFRLEAPAREGSISRSPDGRPTIEIVTLRRSGHFWQKSGTASVGVATLRVTTVTAENEAPQLRDQNLDAGSPDRCDFSLNIPLEVVGLWVSETGTGEDRESNEWTVFIDLKDPWTN